MYFSQSFGLLSKNPVLKNITDYLIEEASAEEEELLGQSTDQEEGQVEDVATVERDDNLIKASLSEILVFKCMLMLAVILPETGRYTYHYR